MEGGSHRERRLTALTRRVKAAPLGGAEFLRGGGGERGRKRSFTWWTDLEIERIAIEDGTAVWNLFLDVEKPRQFTEIAKAVMGDEQGNDPFHTPATQVLADAMVHLHRKGEQEGEMPTHADLLRFLNQRPEEIHRALDEDGLSAAASINPDANGYLNVYQRMKQGVDEVFVSDFAKAGDFSLREYIENPAGRVVIFDTPTDEVETVGPMYSLLLDTSIKFGMTSDTEVNYLLDEIDELPRISWLSSLASAGRAGAARDSDGGSTAGDLWRGRERDTGELSTGNLLRTGRVLDD